MDYTLWNPTWKWFIFYGEPIENLPHVGFSVHAEYNLRNRLITLNQNTVVPKIQLNNLDTVDGTLLTL